jgi:DNA-binding transcriptional MerR regulator
MSKSAEAFRTISEVAEVLDTPAHVLRFWESRFSQVRPVKRAGGRRYYRPNDVALLSGIKKLLHDDGLTIRGVQKLLREKGVRHVAALTGVEFDEANAPAPRRERPAAPAPAVPAAAVTAPMPANIPADLFDLPPAQRSDQSPGAEARAELQRGRDSTLRLQTPPQPSDKSRFEDLENPPAAAMLRAMTALRAGKRQSELKTVFERLSAVYRRRRETADDDRS